MNSPLVGTPPWRNRFAEPHRRRNNCRPRPRSSQPIAANYSGSCNTNTAPDVVYAITATRSGTITVDTSGSAYDTVLYVGNTCGGSTLGCNDDTAGLGLQSRVAFAATAGTTYYVVVDGYSTNSGAYVLNVSGL